MRNFIIITLLALTSCGDAPVSKARHFTRNLPDTSATWSGKRTQETFLVTRQFEKKLHQLTFNYRNPDSLISDTNFIFKITLADSLQLDKFWLLNSQSDLTNGDQFGCLDGNTIFVELADWN